MSDDLQFSDKATRRRMLLSARIAERLTPHTVAVDEAGVIAWASPFLGEKLGYSDSTYFVGKPLSVIIGDNGMSHEEHAGKMRGYRDSGRPPRWLSREASIRDAQGNLHEIAVKIFTVHDADSTGFYDSKDMASADFFSVAELLFTDDLPEWHRKRHDFAVTYGEQIGAIIRNEIIAVPNTEAARDAFMSAMTAGVTEEE